MGNLRVINTGTGPSTGDGDQLRVAFEKINLNFRDIVSGNIAALPSTTVRDYFSMGAPSSSAGSAGDRAGDTRVDVEKYYTYLCVADYTDGTTDIWVRTMISNTSF